jgi:hypothetical protein
MERSTVVPSHSLSLSEVVALDLIVVASEPFPIDLIETVRHHDCGTDNALTGCGFDDELDMTEHDVPF